MFPCPTIRPTLVGVLLLATVFLAGCQGGSETASDETPDAAASTQEAMPHLTDARASSNHYVTVTFSAPAGALAEAAAHYVITSPDGTPLPVLAVTMQADRSGATLSTGAQQPVEYQLTMQVADTPPATATTTAAGPSGAAASTTTTNAAGTSTSGNTVVFTGSTEPEPFLATAMALSPTTVLVTFSDRMDRPTAETAGFYRIVAADASVPPADIAGIEISSAVLSDDETTVVLTTSTLDDIEYLLKITNVEERNNGKLINPVRNTTTFFGIAPDDTVPPRLLQAASTGHTEVVLSFSEPLAPDPVQPANFVLCADDQDPCPADAILPIVDVALITFDTQVRLTTEAQIGGLVYTARVQDVTDQETPQGNVIDPNPSFAPFPGTGLGAPGLLSVVATSNTSLLLTFSELMLESTVEDPQFYRVADPDLKILSAQLVQTGQTIEGDLVGNTVALRTSPQVDTVYTIAVSNVRSLEGLLIDPARSTATFAGNVPKDTTPPHLVEAVATSSTGVLVTFDEPLADAAADPNHFRITFCPQETDPCPGGPTTLDITAVQLVAGNTQALLTTKAQTPGIPHTLEVRDVTDQATPPPPNVIDPNPSMTVFGILLDDTTPPQLLSAEALDSTHVLLSFSEPLADGTDVSGNFSITSPAAPPLTVVEAQLSGGNTRILLTTAPQDASVLYTVAVAAAVTDRASNPIDPAANTATFIVAAGEGLADSTERPRVVGAASTGNTTVQVTFSKQMNDSAVHPSNYIIVQENVNAEAGALLVTGASFPDPADRTVVALTTRSQNELTYRVIAFNVRDLEGNQLAPKEFLSVVNELVDPTSATFPGTPPTVVGQCDPSSSKIGAACSLDVHCIDAAHPNGKCIIASNQFVDLDNDTLGDNEEQRGWVVAVELSDGTVGFREVTSDPDSPDTDGDGLSDATEKAIGGDPRDPDTDDDGLPDAVEFNETFTSPTDQDTDDDGISDTGEVEFFKTNALLADSDGDGFSDAQELFEMHRDPRIADLPRYNITVGDVVLRIDERFTSTNEQGETVSKSSSTSTTLSSGTENSLSQSNSQTLMALVQGTVSGGLSKQNGATFKEFELSATGSGEFAFSNSRASARRAERAFEDSLTKGQELSDSLTVSREVVGASIEANVTLANPSGVAFSLRNLEISVLTTDPQDRSRFIPVATLVPNSTLLTGDPAVFNLGPLEPTRGPIIFASREVFPNLVEDLLRDPRGLIFRVVNVDLTDEFGRNFAFASQVARDRTTGLVVDFGDGTQERYLMSTAAVRERRCAQGTRDGELCSDDADCPGAGAVCEARGIIGGHSDFAGTGTVNGIPIDFALQDILGLKKNSTEPDGILAGPDGSVQTFAQGDDVQLVPAGIDGVPEDTIVIVAGENGVLDTTPAVGSDDVAAVVTGYATSSTCGASTPREILAGPDGDLDSTADPASDDVEGANVILPGANGVIDSIAQIGDIFVSPGIPCTADAECFGGQCDGPEALVRFKNRKIGDVGRIWTLIVPRLPTEIQVGDDRIGTDFGSLRMRPGETTGLAFVRDRDRDGLIAQEEFLFGSSDNDQDSDNDHLDDFAEVKVGWEVNVPGSPLRRVFPDPTQADSDGDGLIDSEEKDLRHLSDSLFGGELSNFSTNKYGCMVSDPADMCDFGELLKRDPTEPFATDPRLTDTDADFVSDFDEVLSYLIGAAVVDPIPSEMIIAGADGVADTTACPTQVCDGGARNGLSCRSDHDCPSSPADRQNGTFFATCDLSTPVCDDIQAVAVGTGVPQRTVVVAPGPDGLLDASTLASFDNTKDERVASADRTASTMAVNDDRQVEPVGKTMLPSNATIVRPGVNGFIDAIPAGDDVRLLGREYVMTDPLERDFDFDGRIDGVERLLGSDPTNPNDDNDSLDSDDDGLTDDEEASAGWLVTVIEADGTQDTPRPVYSNPNVGDSDFDGLPDYVERRLGTDPTSKDTDGDGLSDFDEVSADVFAEFAALNDLFGGFHLDGSGSDMLGTDPTKQDSDGDGVADKLELDGYVVTLPGQGTATRVVTDPTVCDTDDDGLSDGVERGLKLDSGDALSADGTGTAPTDASVADTDGDGRTDGVECCPGNDDLTTCPNTCEPADIAACTGGNPRLPDIRVTVTFARISATFHGGGGEWWWGLWVQKPGDAFPGELVSDPKRGHSVGGACPEFPGDPHPGYFADCNWCAQPNLFNEPLNNKVSFILRPGEGFAVHGDVAELNLVGVGTPACTRVKNNEPRLSGPDVDKCSMSVPFTTFSYEELVDSGFTGRQLEFEIGTSNDVQNCQGNVNIEIQVE
jgi:hypothetical protein